MITPVVIADTQRLGGILKTATYPGQWCYVTSGTAGAAGEFFVTPVAASGTLIAEKVFPVMFHPTTSDDEETYQDATPVPSGQHIVALVGKGIVVEDDYVYTRLGAATFTGMAIGTELGLNASGYPTAIASGTSQVAVATFLGLEGTAVRYRTL